MTTPLVHLSRVCIVPKRHKESRDEGANFGQTNMYCVVMPQTSSHKKGNKASHFPEIFSRSVTTSTDITFYLFFRRGDFQLPASKGWPH